MNAKTKKLTTLAMLCAIAFAVMTIGRIPVVMFLKYDPKDVIITLGGFLFGPLSAFIISAVVSVIEMITVSDTWIIGCIMNILSSCSFACVASYIYKKNPTMKNAFKGLVLGCLTMTAAMLLWNYLIAPIYMGQPREAIADLLLPVFLPFNLLKGGLNTAVAFMLYEPVINALRKIGFAEGIVEKADKMNKQQLFTVVTLMAVTIGCFLGLVNNWFK